MDTAKAAPFSFRFGREASVLRAKLRFGGELARFFAVGATGGEPEPGRLRKYGLFLGKIVTASQNGSFRHAVLGFVSAPAVSF